MTPREALDELFKRTLWTPLGTLNESLFLRHIVLQALPPETPDHDPATERRLRDFC